MIGYFLLFVTPVLGAAVPTIHELRTAHDEATRQFRTGRVVYRVQVAEPAKRPTFIVPSDEQLRDSQVSRRQYEEAFQVTQLAGDRDELRVIQFDYTKMQWRVDTQDLRDIDALMEQAGLPAAQRMNVERSSTRLSNGDLEVVYRPLARLCWIKTANRARSTLEGLSIQAGLLPKQLLDNPNVTASFGQGSSGEMAEVSFALKSQTVTIKLAAHSDSRYSEMGVYGRDGRLRKQYIAKDYRTIDGVSLPMVSEIREWASDGSLFKTEVFTVQEASFNAVLQQAVFRLSLPPKTFIDDSGKMVAVTEVERLVTVDELAAMAGKQRPASGPAPATLPAAD